MLIKFDRIAVLSDRLGKKRLSVMPTTGGVDKDLLCFYKCVYTNNKDRGIVYSSVMTSTDRFLDDLSCADVVEAILTKCRLLYTKVSKSESSEFKMHYGDLEPDYIKKHLVCDGRGLYSNVLPYEVMTPVIMRPENIAMPLHMTPALINLIKAVHPSLSKCDYSSYSHKMSKDKRFDYSNYPTSVSYSDNKISATITYEYNEMFVIDVKYLDTQKKVVWILFAPELLGCVKIK